jgi:hypothetical protein
MATGERTAEASARPAANVPAAIIIRPWPKVIFIYPTFLAALLAGIWQLTLGGDEAASGETTTAAAPAAAPAAEAPTEDAAAAAPKGLRTRETIGLVFFLVFCVNILVLSFEFTRIITVALFFLALAVAFFLLFLSDRWPVFDSIRQLFASLHLTASTSFYFSLASYLALVYAGVFINTRWNYWEIHHNEIIHHTGFLGDIKRFPSPNLRMTKTINDVFEFLLLGSGRIVLYPASEREAVVLENVLNVNKVEHSIKSLLSALKVELASHGEMPSVEEH